MLRPCFRPWGLVGPLGLVLLALGVWATPGLAQDEEDLSASGGELSNDDRPIAVELAQGIDLLNDQITQQQNLLKTAQSEREQELIRNHIRLLQKERRTLESLLNKLVGPGFEAKESAQEQQAEKQAERYEKTLEKDERFPTP